MKKALAIVCGDIHLSARPPIARAGEPDWFDAMRCPLFQLRQLRDDLELPILYAGDIFHTWNSSAELINFALECLPSGMAIPGQHDLPYHNRELIERSAFWTLVKAGVLKQMDPGGFSFPSKKTGQPAFGCAPPTMALYGYGWGDPLKGRADASGLLPVAVIHRFCWMSKDTGFKGAPETGHVTSLHKYLKDFRVVICGDNHKPFETTVKKTLFYNCGGFMRRNIDEVDHRPSVGILFDDGTVRRQPLSIEGEVFMSHSVIREMRRDLKDVESFVRSLEKLEGGNENFEQALKHYLETNPVNDRVRSIIMESLA